MADEGEAQEDGGILGAADHVASGRDAEPEIVRRLGEALRAGDASVGLVARRLARPELARRRATVEGIKEPRLLEERGWAGDYLARRVLQRHDALDGLRQHLVARGRQPDPHIRLDGRRLDDRAVGLRLVWPADRMLRQVGEETELHGSTSVYAASFSHSDDLVRCFCFTLTPNSVQFSMAQA